MNKINPVETEPNPYMREKKMSLSPIPSHSTIDRQTIRPVVELPPPVLTVGHHDRILLSSVSDHGSYRRHEMPCLNSGGRFLVSSVSVFFKYTYILKCVLFWEN
jgi:hypothetical protein